MHFWAKGLSFVLSSSLILPTPRPDIKLIQEKDLRAHVSFLASKNMRGRKTASNEARIAADYIAAEFQKMGLKPVGDRGSYFQDYPLSVASQDDENIAFTVQSGSLKKSYQLDRDFDLFWITQSTNPSIATAPVVFAGYGINAPEYGYNDLAHVDIRGKIVMVLPHEPQEFDPQSKFKGTWNTYHAYDQYKYQDLINAGAIGILDIQETYQHRPPDAPSAPRQDWFSDEIYSLPGLWDVPAFSITEDVANELLKKTGKTVAGLRSEIDRSYQPESFEIPGLSATLRKDYKNRYLSEGRNVVGLLEGSDPKLKDEYVVVSAHYDHLGVVNGRVIAGADDDASGTAAVMEIARALSQGHRPRRSVLFVAFDSEEAGLLGAYYFANHPLLPLNKLIADLNMDMIGRDENTPTWQLGSDHVQHSVNIVGTPYSPELRRVLEKANNGLNLALDYKTDKDDREEWFSRADNFVFSTRGVPAILFNTGEHADYHTENDTAERLNYQKMEQIARLVYKATFLLANEEFRPKFDATPSSSK